MTIYKTREEARYRARELGKLWSIKQVEQGWTLWCPQGQYFPRKAAERRQKNILRTGANNT